jgi:glycosyltransferase involved in cell wall biosynthesis
MPTSRRNSAQGRKRLGVVITELGIPSEIWAARQAAEMTRFEPVFLAWRHAPEPAWGDTFETRLIDGPFPGRNDLIHRIAGKLGSPRAVLPTAVEAAAIRAAVEGAQVEAVFCHFAWTAIPVAAALPADVPLIAQVHGRDVSTLMGDRAYSRALARMLPRLDALAAVGRFQLDRLRPLGLGARHEVIPCGAPFDQFSARPMPERPEGAPLRLISVGRIAAEKGVMKTLEALETLPPDIEAEWICIGDGPDMPALRAAVAAGPAKDRVHLPGRLTPAQVAEELSRAHVFVQHSRQEGGSAEGFGVSLTEAGAAGLPLVASRLGGIVDQLTDGENGFLHTPDDVTAQRAAIVRLARDEALRRRMGVTAREVAQHFDSRLMTARLETLIAEAIAARA